MFIAFEGLDGSGRSTQSKLLAEKLEKDGRSVFLTNEPTDTSPIGRMIRDILRHKWQCSPKGLQLLFSADRAEHLHNEIEPALREGKIVITDRYFFSTIAYGSLEVDDWEWLKCLSKDSRVPDITFLFKLDPEECIRRIHGRGGEFELFEKKEKLEKIWEGYERLAKEYPNIHIIDASGSIEEISHVIFNTIMSS